jgi:hypothetical protein
MSACETRDRMVPLHKTEPIKLVQLSSSNESSRLNLAVVKRCIIAHYKLKVLTLRGTFRPAQYLH